MNKNLLIIGAGASTGAREGKHRPPLGENLLHYIQKHIKRFDFRKGISTDPFNYFASYYPFIFCEDEIQKVSAKIQIWIDKNIAFEEAVSSMLKNRDSDFAETTSILNRLIAFIFSGDTKHGPRDLAFADKPDLYDTLISKFSVNSEWRCINLNYDVLFEQACARKNIGWYYHDIKSGSMGSSTQIGLPILKIHGSINWFPIKPQTIRDIENASQEDRAHATLIADFQKENLISSTEFPGTFANSANCIIQEIPCFRKPGNSPVMAHYSSGKSVSQNYQIIKDVRNRALAEANAATKVFIIGVRAIPTKKAGDDPTLETIFSKITGKDVEYINPSEEECKDVTRRFGFTPKPFTFEQWLNNN